MLRHKIIEGYLSSHNLLKKKYSGDIKEIALKLDLEIEMNTDPENDFKYTFGRYVKEILGYQETSEINYLFAGVLAFIWANEFGEPYQPIQLFLTTDEQPKKWWQIWR